MMNFQINEDPYFFTKVDNYLLAENYLSEIYKNVHKRNLSFLGIWTGQHRVGKSIGAVQFGDILDPTYREALAERTVYSSYDFMDSMENIRKDHIKGGVTIWDETQIKHGSRDWYKDVNKSINSAIQAFGYLNPIVFFVTQDPTFIDSQPRKLFHSFYEVKRQHNYWNYILPFNIKYNRRQGKPYYIYPRYKFKYYGSMSIKSKLVYIRMLKPETELIKLYDNHSQRFKDKFLDETHKFTKARQELEQEKINEMDTKDSDIILDILENHFNDPVFLSKFGNYRPEHIRAEYKLSYRHAQRISQQASVKRKEMMKTSEE